MAISIQQKVDYLLKKLGYSSSKTGIAEDSSISGTKKAPFAEALPPMVNCACTSCERNTKRSKQLYMRQKGIKVQRYKVLTLIAHQLNEQPNHINWSFISR